MIILNHSQLESLKLDIPWGKKTPVIIFMLREALVLHDVIISYILPPRSNIEN